MGAGVCPTAPHMATPAFLHTFCIAWIGGCAMALGAAHAASCALDRAVFRDSGGQGFVLSFSEARSPHDAQVTARARITHPQRGTLFKFEMGRTNGYGANYLVQTPLPGQDKAERQRPHGVYFFDTQLKPLMVQPDPPAWLFIENLGAADHYDARHRTPPGPGLQDPMWVFAYCKK